MEVAISVKQSEIIAKQQRGSDINGAERRGKFSHKCKSEQIDDYKMNFREVIIYIESEIRAIIWKVIMKVLVS